MNNSPVAYDPERIAGIEKEVAAKTQWFTESGADAHFFDRRHLQDFQYLLSLVAGLKQDADRYRHLRENTELCLTGDDHGLGPECYYVESLDDVVDASMSPLPPEEAET